MTNCSVDVKFIDVCRLPHSSFHTIIIQHLACDKKPFHNLPASRSLIFKRKRVRYEIRKILCCTSSNINCLDRNPNGRSLDVDGFCDYICGDDFRGCISQ